MEKYQHDNQKESELQLLPTRPVSNSSFAPPTTIHPSDLSSKFRSNEPHRPFFNQLGPSLDLQLSISLQPSDSVPIHPACDDVAQLECVEVLRWQASEQIRLSAIEKDYVKRVREMSKREIELAQSEFTRARKIWERAREEVEKAEEITERSRRRIDSGCMEITCPGCRLKFLV